MLRIPRTVSRAGSVDLGKHILSRLGLKDPATFLNKWYLSNNSDISLTFSSDDTSVHGRVLLRRLYVSIHCLSRRDKQGFETKGILKSQGDGSERFLKRSVCRDSHIRLRFIKTRFHAHLSILASGISSTFLMRSLLQELKREAFCVQSRQYRTLYPFCSGQYKRKAEQIQRTICVGFILPFLSPRIIWVSRRTVQTFQGTIRIQCRTFSKTEYNLIRKSLE